MWLTPEEWSAVRLSVQVGCAAVACGLPCALPLGYLLARRNFPGKWLLELFLDLPLVLPPVVTGYILLRLCSPRGWLGELLQHGFGWQIVFHWTGAVLAAVVVSFPLMVRALRIAFAGVDPRLELASRSLGVSPWMTFWRVTFPLAQRGVWAGCVLAFARSLGEFGATILVAANIPGETRTLPLAIYSAAQRPGGDTAAWRLVILSILLAAVALWISGRLERRVVAS